MRSSSLSSAKASKHGLATEFGVEEGRVDHLSPRTVTRCQASRVPTWHLWTTLAEVVRSGVQLSR